MTGDMRERPLGKIDLGDGHFVAVHHMSRIGGGEDRVGLSIGDDDENFLAAVMEPHEAALLASRILSAARRCSALRDIDPQLEALAAELDIPLQ